MSPYPTPPKTLIEVLAQLTGVQREAAFRFYDEAHQPVNCELVVSPAQGWAVATEQHDASRKGGGALATRAAMLAVNICQQYGIAPTDLTLFARYEYGSSYESIYVVHFAHGTQDLFDGIRFTGVSRQLLDPDQGKELYSKLGDGSALTPSWRAIRSKGL